MKNIIISLTLFLFAAGMVMAQGKEKLEPLYGINFSDEHVIIRVKSNGCTSKENFLIKKNKSADTYQVSIIRIKKDRCRARPRITSIELPLVKESLSNTQTKWYSYKINNRFLTE